jgi:tRNA(fMet)-specific endonuclease VapC
MKYFLDTNICIYYMHRKVSSLSQKLLSHNPKDIKIPSVVVAELFYGVNKSVKRTENLLGLKSFLKPVEIISFDEAAAECYGDIRAALELRGKPIGGNDMMIAAIVLSRAGILVTNNTKEFLRVTNLHIENWVE